MLTLGLGLGLLILFTCNISCPPQDMLLLEEEPRGSQEPPDPPLRSDFRLCAPVLPVLLEGKMVAQESNKMFLKFSPN